MILSKLRRIRSEFFPKRDEFDRKHGTRTAGKVSPCRLDVSSPNASSAVHYQTMPPEELQRGLDFIGCDWSDFTFLDLGCGKGRALIVASEAGFKRVIGVEIAQSLADAASRNAKLAGVKAEVKCQDAAEFPMPAGDLVVFMYNPFGAPVMAEVIEQMRARAGRLFVLYANPVCSDLLDAAPFLVRVGDAPDIPLVIVWRSR